MASSALHSILVKHTLMHQLKMSLIWLNVLRELKCGYLVSMRVLVAKTLGCKISERLRGGETLICEP